MAAEPGTDGLAGAELGAPELGTPELAEPELGAPELQVVPGAGDVRPLVAMA